MKEDEVNSIINRGIATPPGDAEADDLVAEYDERISLGEYILSEDDRFERFTDKHREEIMKTIADAAASAIDVCADGDDERRAELLNSFAGWFGTFLEVRADPMGFLDGMQLAAADEIAKERRAGFKVVEADDLRRHWPPPTE